MCNKRTLVSSFFPPSLLQTQQDGRAFEQHTWYRAEVSRKRGRARYRGGSPEASTISTDTIKTKLIGHGKERK
jgi:hypothetical protein